MSTVSEGALSDGGMTVDDGAYGSAVRRSDNLSTLADVTEDVIVATIEQRFQHDVIYTLIGDILIAVNPFKPIDIYTTAFHNLYMPEVAVAAWHACLGPCVLTVGVSVNG